MGKEFEAIDDSLKEFIEDQKMFFVATAPLDQDGLVNLSPKGLDSFRILGPNQVAYIDLTGSGIETMAHLKENGRITILFCAFDGRPRILRLYGKGRTVEPHDGEWAELAPRFPEYKSARSIIVVDCTLIRDACGFGVPRFSFDEDRTQLVDWFDRLEEGGVGRYQEKKNMESLDGLKGLARPGTA